MVAAALDVLEREHPALTAVVTQREPETALDYWLRTALRERYDGALAEPVPEWLL